MAGEAKEKPKGGLASFAQGEEAVAEKLAIFDEHLETVEKARMKGTKKHNPKVERRRRQQLKAAGGLLPGG